MEPQQAAQICAPMAGQERLPRRFSHNGQVRDAMIVIRVAALHTPGPPVNRSRGSGLAGESSLEVVNPLGDNTTGEGMSTLGDAQDGRNLKLNPKLRRLMN
ncbi:MAG: hypothetical protein CL483_13830 [Acidobacteria bacterium]|nr:hypothetical protein [Acidobacteriota bacterium]